PTRRSSDLRFDQCVVAIAGVGEQALAVAPQRGIGVFVELVLPLRKEIPSDAFDRIDAAANLVRAGDAPLVFGVDSIICPLELAAVDFDDAAKLLERGGELLLRIGLCIARVR